MGGIWHVWTKEFHKLPQDVKDAYEATRHNGQGPKGRNKIVNSILAKDTKYGDSLSLNSETFTAFRAVKNMEGVAGFTITEMIGPGKMGSMKALHAGIERGDVVVKKNKAGKELYYLDRGSDSVETEDKIGGKAKAKGDGT